MATMNNFWEELNDIIESYTREEDPISEQTAIELIKELDKKSDVINLDPDKILKGTVEDYNEDGIISYVEYYDDSSYGDGDYDYSSPSY